MAEIPDNTDPDALLDALESIKHLLDEESGTASPARTPPAAAPRGTTRKATAHSSPRPASPANTGSGKRSATPSAPASDDEEDLVPILDQVVRPGELTATERAALARALIGLQEVLNQRIEQTLRQASRQIADKLKQDLQRQIDALLRH